MDMEIVEIECPLCDRKIAADAPRCPHCGAEFAMSDLEDLERVAQELNGHPAPERPVENTAGTEAVEAATVHSEEKGGRGFLSKLFRKRR